LEETTLIPRIRESKTTPWTVTEKALMKSGAIKKAIAINGTLDFSQQFNLKLRVQLMPSCSKKNPKLKLGSRVK